MSSGGPNIQQMPRDPDFRNCFIAAHGNVLVVADYSMMELRAIAEIASDNGMRADFAQGIDLHHRTAALVNSIPYGTASKEQRNAAKPINFGTIYGAGGAGLARSAWANYEIKMTAAEAAAARDRLLGRYAGAKRWMRRNADACQRRGYIEIGIFGRVIMAEWEAPAPPRADNNYPSWNRRSWEQATFDAHDLDDWEKCADLLDDDELACAHSRAKAAPPRSALKYTLCCNAPIQGACADAMMLALARIDKLLADRNIDGGLVLAVHDELVLEVRAEQARQAAELLTQAMVEAFLKVFPNAPVNRLVKTEIAGSWGEVKS
jgi:DNA polymerase I-like protein with 3'-5' exonuclease and polymerase domains